MMRIILYTGKGGVGKTSIAAATAIKSAKQGKKTLIVSADAAHSLGDSLDIKLSPEPVEIMQNLWAQEIDSTHEIEKGWGKVQQYMTNLLTAKTVKDITTEELTVFPGMEELLSLLRILDYYKKKTYEIIIVDCAPTGETLALLSFPDMMRWWMEKLFPLKRKAIKVVRPVVEPLVGLPLPTDDVMGQIEEIYHNLDEMRQILSDKEVTSIRLVVNPEKMVIKEAQRSFTYLNIYSFPVDAIIVNRVIPNNVIDQYFQVWKSIQKKYLDLINESFAPLPQYFAPLFEREVIGTEMLERMAENVFGAQDPTTIKYLQRIQEIIKDKDGYTFSLYLPFTEKKDLTLNKKGDELIIRAGNVKRIITLPRTLLNQTIKGAKFEEDLLRIYFGGTEHA